MKYLVDEDQISMNPSIIRQHIPKNIVEENEIYLKNRKVNICAIRLYLWI